MGIVAVGAEQVSLLRRSSCRCAGRAPPPSSPAASRRGTGRRAGRTRSNGTRSPLARWSQSRSVGVVAVQAPAVLLVVPELDVVVHLREDPPGAVHLQVRVAARAGEDPLREGGRGDLEALVGGARGRRGCRPAAYPAAARAERQRAPPGRPASWGCLLTRSGGPPRAASRAATSSGRPGGGGRSRSPGSGSPCSRRRDAPRSDRGPPPARRRRARWRSARWR